MEQDRSKPALKTLLLAAVFPALLSLCACASSSQNENSCAQRFRQSAEGRSMERCFALGGVAVFQGDSGVFTDCRFQPGSGDKKWKAPGGDAAGR